MRYFNSFLTIFQSKWTDQNWPHIVKKYIVVLKSISKTPSNGPNSTHTTHNWAKLLQKRSAISTTFQKYANQSNLTNVEFKMLINGLCPLV